MVSNQEQRRLQGLKNDLNVVYHRGKHRLRFEAKRTPLFLPSWKPETRSLQIRSGLDCSQLGSRIDCREVHLPRFASAVANQTARTPPLMVFEVSPGSLLTDGLIFHAVLTGNGSVLREASEDHRSQDLRAIRRIQRLPRSVYSGSVVSLLTGNENLGHWLYNVLPRLYLIEQAGMVGQSDRYLVPPIDREFKRTTLGALGIKEGQCIEVGEPVVVHARRLVAAVGHRHGGHVEPWIPMFLRESFLGSPAQGKRRLYINRRDTKLRRILNEEAVESCLAKHGFESVSLADYDFNEKVALYSSAEAIVAAHGAGLACLAFCHPGTKVLELAGDRWFGPGFEDVAAAVDLDYHATSAMTTTGARFLPDIARNVTVDVGMLASAAADLFG